ncbi:MAG TPA: NAD(P)-binding domain-containing protein, partial [Thermoplasmata archaeon]|nr:NAD(P)-binding domain-containing protein [Thermoplasmata archaeon]
MKGRKVGILGSGDVGKRLGDGFARHGFEVMVGSRDPAKLESWRKETQGKVSVGTFAETAAHGEIVILATHGEGTESAVELAGPPNFRGKLVLDATNPLDFSHGMPPGLFVGTTDSLGERVQRRLPDARVVKCFNTVGNARMIDPHFDEGTPPMIICGDDAGAKKETEAILRELGWPGALDAGGIEGARWLEALVPLWVRVGASLNTW